MSLVDVLIPTFRRPAALAVTMTCLSFQTFADIRVVVSDQSDDMAAVRSGEVQAVRRLLELNGTETIVMPHLPRRGMAEQRQFLLDQAQAPYSLFLDDDVLLERGVVERMVTAIREERCGFVGSALVGLSHLGDVRPHEQQIEFWEGRVTPEVVRPGTPAWERYHLHNAANLYHAAVRLGIPLETPRKYRVAWVGGCVMYDTASLRAAGGFEFWKDLPAEHCGEDVLAQLRVMARRGGCALIPSGVYHQELPTTVEDRRVNAPAVLPVETVGTIEREE